MKLKDFIKKLQEIADKHPNLTVVVASNKEATTLSKVDIDPVAGTFRRGKFTHESYMRESPNSVLIN